MVEVGQKYILHSENGLDYDIEVVNVNHFRELNRIYAVDIYHKGQIIYPDIMFVGDDFINKCELVEEN